MAVPVLTDLFAVYAVSGTEYFRVDSSGNLLGSAENIGSTTLEAGSIYLADAKGLSIGNDQDLTIAHSGTAGTVTNTTGDVTFDNQAATGKWYFDLGTDTNATGFYVRNNSGATQFSVLGDGTLSFGGPWVLLDGVQIRLGTSTDATIEYVGADNDLLIDNTNTAGETVCRLGTDTNATQFSVKNNSNTVEFSVLGDGTTNIGANAADTGAINIGNVNAAKAIYVGNAASASLALEAGIGALTANADTSVAVSAGTTFDVQAAGAVTIDSSGGAIKIGGDAVAQNLELGNCNAARAISIGHAASASLTMEAGVGAWSLTGDTSGTLTAGTTLTLDAAGTLAIDSSGGAISIGSDNVAQNIEIGNAGARTLIVGNAASASLTLEAGVGALTINADAASTWTVGTSITLATPVLDLDGYLDLDVAYTAAGYAINSLATINHATDALRGISSTVQALTTARTTGDAYGFLFAAEGLAGDQATADYIGFFAGGVTKNGGASIATAMKLAAGYDVALDFSSCATGEADILVADDKASALQIREGANPILTVCSTNGSESIASAYRLTTTDGVASGTARVVGGLAYSNTAASAAVTNSTAEVAFDKSYTLPVSTLKAGSTIRIRAQGIATATNGTDTLTVRLKIGNTVIAASDAVDVANSDVFGFYADLVVRTVGTGGTIVGMYTIAQPGAVEAADKVEFGMLASTAIDTTATQAITVTAQWSAASTANSCRLDILTVDVV